MSIHHNFDSREASVTRLDDYFNIWATFESQKCLTGPLLWAKIARLIRATGATQSINVLGTFLATFAEIGRHSVTQDPSAVERCVKM